METFADRLSRRYTNEQLFSSDVHFKSCFVESQPHVIFLSVNRKTYFVDYCCDGRFYSVSFPTLCQANRFSRLLTKIYSVSGELRCENPSNELNFCCSQFYDPYRYGNHH